MDIKNRPFDILIILTLGICAFLAYSNTFEASFHYDDNISIVFNESIHMVEFSLGRLFSTHTPGYPYDRPLAWISFALNYYFGGLNTFGYHVVNVIIHIITGIGVYFLIKAIMDLVEGEEDKRPVAAAAALLWILSPVQTQAVTYIVQRMTSLSAMFYVFSLISYIRWRTGRGGALHLLLSISFFIASMASKQTGITLPVVLLLFEITFFWRSRKGFRFFSLMFFFMLLMGAFLYYSDLSLSYLFATGYAMEERFLTGMRIVVYYVGTLIFPVASRQALIYDFPPSRGMMTPFLTLPALCFVAGICIISLCRLRRDPLISFFLLWFMATILPETLYHKIGLIYDHRMYIPSMGFYALFACFLWRMINGRIAVLLVLVLATLFLINTYNRNMDWQDDVSLWLDNVKKAPAISASHEGLATAYLKTGDIERAEAELRTAKGLNPFSSFASVGLAIVYYRKGNIEESISQLEYLASRKRMGFMYYYTGMAEDIESISYELRQEGMIKESDEVGRLWLELKPTREQFEGITKLKVVR